MMRTLRSPISRVRRAVARTRRSSCARCAVAGSATGLSPAGSIIGSRASVCASIEFDLACRDKNRRRSAAFWVETRNTVCPRPPNHTATGSHAGPVGSITSSSVTPAGAPASAVRSSSVKLSTVGTTRRLATTWPVSSRTWAVCAVAIPRSSPTIRLTVLSCMTHLLWLGITGWTPAVPARRRPNTTVPRSSVARGSPRPPLMCCNRGPARRPAPLPSTGSSVAGPGRPSAQRGNRSKTVLRGASRLHPGQPGCHHAPWDSAVISHRSPLHEA
jgi:hypothetical protein